MPGGNPGIRVDTICFDKLSKSLDIKADAHAKTAGGVGGVVVGTTVGVEVTKETVVARTRRPSPPRFC